MRDQTQLKPGLLKSLLAVVGAEILLTAATIKIIIWSAAHGRPHWTLYVPAWDGVANLALLFGWIAFVQFWKRKPPTPQ